MQGHPLGSRISMRQIGVEQVPTLFVKRVEKWRQNVFGNDL